MAAKYKAPKKGRHTAPKARPEIAGPRSGEIRCPEQPQFEGRARRLPTCPRRVRGLVLPRAPTVVEPHRRPEVSHALGISKSGARHDQPAPRGRPAARLRSRGLRVAEPGSCGRHPPSEGRQEVAVTLGNWLTAEQASTL
jgi:hypothetical protein